MSRNGLGPRWIRRLTRLTGLDVIHGSASGYGIEFTTTGHRHGWFDMKTWRYGGGPTWGLYEEGYCPRFTSCSELFPVDAARRDEEFKARMARRAASP